MQLKSKLAKDIISKIVTERRQEERFYKEYESKKQMKEETNNLNQHLNKIDREMEALSKTIENEKEIIPQELEITQKYGEFIITTKDKKGGMKDVNERM
jgi:hypothetical protein